jgi:hypothetical protein
MKALPLLAALFLTSTSSFAASVCTLSLPGICGSTASVNCDGKEMPAYGYKNCGNNDESRKTSTLKKLLDQEYKIVSHVALNPDGGEIYTLAK